MVNGQQVVRRAHHERELDYHERALDYHDWTLGYYDRVLNHHERWGRRSLDG